MTDNWEQRVINDLAERAKADKSAFASLYEYFYERILNYSFSYLHNREDAEDITADVFFKVLKNIKNYQSDRSFCAWIFKIAKNSIIDYLNKASYSIESISYENHIELINPVLNTDSGDVEITLELNRLLNTLDGTDREIIILKYLSELSVAEIALIYEMPEKTVYTRISRAIAKLQSHV